MNTTIKHALWGVALAGGITLLGATAANAADTTGEDGLLSGTQVVAPLTAPLSVEGNSITVIGDSSASGADSGSGSSDGVWSASTSGEDGLGSGTQVVAPATIPVTASGNSITVIGDSTSSGGGIAPQHSTGSGASSTDGSDAAASGTQVVAPVHAPIHVGGNAVTVIGDSRRIGPVERSSSGSGDAGSAPATTSGQDGVASGTQVVAPATAPVTASDNALTVIGDSRSSGDSGSDAGPTGSGDASTSGEDGVLSGSQVVAPVTAPLRATGNAITVIGDPTAGGNGGSTGGTTGGTTGGSTTSGQDGTGSGTQVVAPITAPITVGGNAVTVVGDPSTGGSNPGGTTTPGTPGTTPGSTGGTVTAAGSIRSGGGAGGLTALAATGADGSALLTAAFAGAALALGGGLLIRRRA